jgi:ABC-2 type transport system ATP-binding protein
VAHEYSEDDSVASDALVTNALSRRFGRREALQSLSLAVRPGEVYGFLGPNGAGKTTAIRCILGLIAPSSGHVSIFGESDAVRRRRDVGAMVETPAFHEFLTGHENLLFSAAYADIDPAAIPAALEQVGLSDRCHDRVDAYSLGMRQRLGLARAILGAPRLLILDEPTNGMDPRGMKDVRDLLHRLAEGGTTVFVSSHLLAEVAQMCGRVGILDRGILVHEGAVDAGLEDVYLSVTAGGVG